MIVNDFYVINVVPMPHKADSILVVDANAVLTLPTAFEFLQAITRRRFQVLEVDCGIEQGKFALGHARRWRTSGFTGGPDLRRGLVGERLDHWSMITNIVNNVNRY